MTLQTMLITALAVASVVILLLLRRERNLRRRRDVLLGEKDVAYSFVHDVGDIFGGRDTVDISVLLERVLFYAQRATKATAGVLYMIDESNDEFTARAVSGMFPPIVEGLTENIENASSKIRFVEKQIKEQPLRRGQGILGRVALTGRAIIIPNAELDSRVPQFAQEYLQIHSILAVSMRFHDSILGVLSVINRVDGEPFTETDQNLLEALADQASVSIYYMNQSAALEEKSRIDRDLNLAKEIQSALLPRKIPQLPGTNIAAFSVPAQVIGGDYYDLIKLDDAHMGIVIADVSGKGISGAIVMSICRSTLRTHAPGNLSPASVLKRANAVISNDLSEDLFISILYMILNTEKQELTVARAGHVRPILFGSGRKEPERIDSAGMAIGIADPDDFDELLEEKTVALLPGDTVIAFTDGVTEAMDGEDNEWGVDNLIKTVQSTVRNKGNAEQNAQAIRQEMMDFVGDTPQYDDMTLVALQVSQGEQAGT